MVSGRAYNLGQSGAGESPYLSQRLSMYPIIRETKEVGGVFSKLIVIEAFEKRAKWCSHELTKLAKRVYAMAWRDHFLVCRVISC